MSNFSFSHCFLPIWIICHLQTLSIWKSKICCLGKYWTLPKDKTWPSWKHLKMKNQMLVKKDFFVLWNKSRKHCGKRRKCCLSNIQSSNQSIKIQSWVLTHYQTTNFRLFQTERVCRRQFQIWPKWQKVIQMGRKHCRKRINCSLQAISPLSTVFSKGLFPRGVKRRRCMEMG